MKLIIDISDKIYRHAKNVSEDSNDEWNAMRAISNGTPIPDNDCNSEEGEWIPIPFELEYASDAECSLCHEKFVDALRYEYCPLCGKKMKTYNGWVFG